MPGMLIEQGVIHEESGTFTPITYTKNTIEENQY